MRENAIGGDTVLNGRAGNYLVTNHGRYMTNTYDPPPAVTVYARKQWNGGDPAPTPCPRWRCRATASR